VSNVPDLGKNFFVQNGLVRGKDEIVEKWSKTGFVESTRDVESTGWLLDVLVFVDRIKKQEFSLDDVYVFEGHLKGKHPANHNVRAKVRQRLQFLMDKGVIEFMGGGKYRKKLKG